MALYEAYQRELSAGDLLSPDFMEQASDTLHRWGAMSVEDVLGQMPGERVIDLGERATSLVVVEPDKGVEVDEERTLTLGLPHKNGWSPQHFIRAKLLQQITAPNSRIIVFPDDGFRHNTHRYTDSDIQKMNAGNAMPIAETQMTALESVAGELGLRSILASGYSKAGRSALGLAAAGSYILEVKKVNADETPSEEGRGFVRLGLDFMTSGADVSGAAKASNIPALHKIMRPGELNKDFVKFALTNANPGNLKDVRSMTGSADYLIRRAVRQIGPENVKIGYIEGSKLFDPNTVPLELLGGIELEHYAGEGFFGHASGDNVVLHAAMANRGLNG
ncbi:MAG TPA: hypothetical protein VFK11_03425 [Candidatus Saccharimonadales bacterium]|nr:hypothetical protein [Candidatus Saccharimonadales bacterium]